MTLPVQIQSDEQVVALLRRHPIYVILQIVGIIIFAMLLVSLFTWMQSQVSSLRSVMDILNITTAVIALGAVGFIYYQYRNDLWLLTNQRLVDSIKTHPFSHEVSSADLLNLQDISVAKKGIFPTLFNFGDVRCQTAGSTIAFILHGVPNPNGVLELIDETRDRARERAMKLGTTMGT